MASVETQDVVRVRLVERSGDCPHGRLARFDCVNLNVRPGVSQVQVDSFRDVAGPQNLPSVHAVDVMLNRLADCDVARLADVGDVTDDVLCVPLQPHLHRAGRARLEVTAVDDDLDVFE
jgi:hypothetical protein